MIFKVWHSEPNVIGGSKWAPLTVKVPPYDNPYLNPTLNGHPNYPPLNPLTTPVAYVVPLKGTKRQIAN